MKGLDVTGTGKRPTEPGAPARAAAKPSRDAVHELRRRADVNARAEAARAAAEAELFGSRSWVPRRRGWLGGSR